MLLECQRRMPCQNAGAREYCDVHERTHKVVHVAGEAWLTCSVSFCRQVQVLQQAPGEAGRDDVMPVMQQADQPLQPIDQPWAGPVEHLMPIHNCHLPLADCSQLLPACVADSALTCGHARSSMTKARRARHAVVHMGVQGSVIC